MNVEDFLDVPVVGGDLEDGRRLTLNTRDVDGYNVVRHSTPTDVAIVLLHLEYLRPQPAAAVTHKTRLAYVLDTTILE